MISNEHWALLCEVVIIPYYIRMISWIRYTSIPLKSDFHTEEHTSTVCDGIPVCRSSEKSGNPETPTDVEGDAVESSKSGYEKKITNEGEEKYIYNKINNISSYFIKVAPRRFEGVQ